MAKILIPKLSNYENCTDFFKDLVKINKKAQPKFSHRYLALALKWPISYTADLIQGRKRFTLKRALELAQYAKLPHLDTEKLIQLSLADSPNADVKNYFSEVVQRKTKYKSSYHNKTTNSHEQFFTQIEVGAVYEVLKWAPRPLAAAEIKELLYTFKDLSEERIQKIINLLIEQKAIQIKGDKISILVNEMVLDQFDDGSDGGVKIHRQYAQNFIHFTEAPQSPGLFTSGFIELSPEHFKEAANRLLEVRNWMFSVHAADAALAKSAKANSLYQFDINLVNILDKVGRQKY